MKSSVLLGLSRFVSLSTERTILKCQKRTPVRADRLNGEMNFDQQRN